MRQYLRYILAALVILVITFIVDSIILNGAKSVSLSGNNYYSALSLALLKSHGTSYQPIEGKDYKVASTAYFDNKQWLAIMFDSENNFSDSGMIVFKENGSAYKYVMGPSSQGFSKSQLQILPLDLQRYVNGGKSV